MSSGGHETDSDVRTQAGPGPVAIRMAGNETTARTINEAIEEGRVTAVGRIGFACECGTLGCSNVLELSVDEYEDVRAASQQFLVAPGHEAPTDLVFVQVPARYTIVGKSGAGAELAAETDPRADRPAVRLTWSRGRRLSVIGLTVEASPASVSRTRGWLVGFAAEHGADAELQARVALAATEAMTNAVAHAYASDRPGRVEVSADVEDDELEIVVADEGTGFRPGESGGLGAGLTVIARTADRFAIRERTPQGIEVWMRFGLTSGAVATE